MQTVKLAISEAVHEKKLNKKEMSLFVHTYVATGLFVLCQNYGESCIWSFPMKSEISLLNTKTLTSLH